MASRVWTRARRAHPRLLRDGRRMRGGRRFRLFERRRARRGRRQRRERLERRRYSRALSSRPRGGRRLRLQQRRRHGPFRRALPCRPHVRRRLPRQLEHDDHREDLRSRRPKPPLQRCSLRSGGAPRAAPEGRARGRERLLLWSPLPERRGHEHDDGGGRLIHALERAGRQQRAARLSDRQVATAGQRHRQGLPGQSAARQVARLPRDAPGGQHD